MARDLAPDNTDAIRKAIILLGDSGVGKTLLAGTSELSYFLDVEGRAEHVHAHRFVPEQDGKGWDEVVQRVAELRAAPRLEGGFGINFRGIEIKTVVLDTVDRAQELLRMKNANLTVSAADKQKFYGVLLDRMLQDLLWPLFAIPVNIVIISHTQERSLDLVEQKAGVKNAPETGMALEGQVRNRLRNYVDNAFHMVRKQDGSTTVLTTSEVFEGRFLYAKDKRWVFGGKQITVKWVKGQIESDAFTKVFAKMHTGGETKALVDKVRTAILDYAIQEGIMTSKTDAAGGKVIADNVMAPLKAKLETITEETFEAIKDEGLALTKALK